MIILVNVNLSGCCSTYLVEKFKLLQKAKEVLTDTKKRADYDKWRRSGMAMSYKQWCSLNDSIKTVSSCGNPVL